MIRKVAILFLLPIAAGLLSLVVGLLWADSYRTREPKPLTQEEKEFLENGIIDYFGPPDPTAMVGLRFTHYAGDRKIIRIRTCQGSLNLRFDSGISTGTPIRRIDSSWGSFGCKQWMWRSSTLCGQDGQPDIHDDYRVREVTIPFWAPLLLFAAHPIIAFVRGPLRRRRRRKRSQCVCCGYDLTGNTSGVCPECGAPINP